MEERLQQALAALPADYRAAILLCDVEQRSYQEIADAMHCAIGTVRSRIHRARVMLRKHLESGAATTRKRKKTAAQVPAEVAARNPVSVSYSTRSLLAA